MSCETSLMFMSLVYDNILITRSDINKVNSLITLLNKNFSLKDLDNLSYFLGVEVQHTQNDELLLS